MNIQWQNAEDAELKVARSIFLLVDSDPRLLEFLFDPKKLRLRKRAGVLRDEAWMFNDEEQLLLRVALDIWCGSGHVHLWELIEMWGVAGWFRFIRAIGELKSLPSSTKC